MKVNPYLILLMEINLKCIKDSNIRYKTPKENKGKISLILVLATILWVYHKSKGNKSKNKLRLHRTKKLLHSKGNNPQNENTVCGMGDNNANHVSDKELIFQKYRLTHADVWQKPTQYCKPIILQFKINFKKFYWNIVDLQCCVSFMCIAMWNSYIYIHSFPHSFPI